MKKCIKCNIEKELVLFNKRGSHYRNECKDCLKKYRKQYQTDNKDKIAEQRKEYRTENKEQLSEIHKQYRTENKEKLSTKNKEYYKENKNSILEYQQQYRSEHKEKILSDNNKYKANKYNNDPKYRLRKNISRVINIMLHKSNNDKCRLSCLKYLPYTLEKLKIHIRQQFESWMTWDNQGKYNPKIWDDADQSTWTWQLDHIIPQSKLSYANMEDDNFQKCWALSNLRPYSAKQNVLEGNRRK